MNKKKRYFTKGLVALALTGYLTGCSPDQANRFKDVRDNVIDTAFSIGEPGPTKKKRQEATRQRAIAQKVYSQNLEVLPIDEQIERMKTLYSLDPSNLPEDRKELEVFVDLKTSSKIKDKRLESVIQRVEEKLGFEITQSYTARTKEEKKQQEEQDRKKENQSGRDATITIRFEHLKNPEAGKNATIRNYDRLLRREIEKDNYDLLYAGIKSGNISYLGRPIFSTAADTYKAILKNNVTGTIYKVGAEEDYKWKFQIQTDSGLDTIDTGKSAQKAFNWIHELYKTSKNRSRKRSEESRYDRRLVPMQERWNRRGPYR